MHGSHRFAAPTSGALLLALAGLGALAQAAPPPVADFVRWPVYDTLAMSPDGKYLAATVPLEDGRAGVVLRREDMSVSTTIKGGTDAYLDELYWANSRRLFMHFTLPMQFSAGRGWRPEIFAIDADGDNKATMYGYVADLLPEDEEHVLLQVCDPYTCDKQAVYKADVKRLRKRGDKLVLPGEAPTVFADRHGDVLVTWSVDKQGFQVLHARAAAEAEWRVLHEEAKAGIRIDPLRIAPDGSLYAQVETRSGPDRIDRIDLATGKHTPLLRHERVDPREMIWGRDGRTLVGAWFFDGRPEPMFVDPDAPEAQLTAALAAAMPDAHVRVLRFATDGSVALVAVSGDRDPGRYFLYDAKTRRLQFLLAMRPWLENVPLAKTHTVHIAARDSTTLNVLLTLPDGKGPFPLVVIPHGGPRSRDVWGWDGKAQLLASRGIGTLKVDFRGSLGYGRAFYMASARQWGRSLQDDVTDATRWAVAQGHADEDRVCIYGASYGAYAAMMGAIREPGLYRCVVARSGVYDLEVQRDWGDSNNTPQGRAFLDREFGTDPKEWAQYSPSRQAARIDVPLLIAHGGQDERTTLEQFKVMTRALDKAGKRYETFVRSGEGHGFDDERNAIAFAERLVGFLERHLLASPGAKTGPAAR
jgi:dipeptidyl aminopeptidase/acylaminoacyl peptidase